MERYANGLKGKAFFMAFWWYGFYGCGKIAIENPVSSTVFKMPECTQEIQPWMFGHPFQKKTCLWLKGLLPLQPTEICEERQSSKVAGNWFNRGGKERQKNRAKTFEGIGEAMAEQWGNYIMESEEDNGTDTQE